MWDDAFYLVISRIACENYQKKASICWIILLISPKIDTKCLHVTHCIGTTWPRSSPFIVDYYCWCGWKWRSEKKKLVTHINNRRRRIMVIGSHACGTHINWCPKIKNSFVLLSNVQNTHNVDLIMNEWTRSRHTIERSYKWSFAYGS